MFELNIDTDNAAFEDGKFAEVARILEDVAKKLRNGTIAGKCFDINGNSVGRFSCDENEE